tara:strand:+ start:3244 stop:4071 length:828 start_codon:yes stop_codon:yes gene_type:complete
MADQVLFLSITTDEDLIPKTQDAVLSSDMAEKIDAAPAGLGYIVCGVGDDISIGDVPISDLGAGDLELESNSITARNIYFTNAVSGNDTSEFLTEGGLGISGAANFGATVSAAGDIKGLALSATNITASTCPIPAPYCFMQTTTDGLSSSDEKHIGDEATVETRGTNSAYITWNDTDKAFNVSADGVYEVHAIVSLGVAATTTVALGIVKATGAVEVVKNTYNLRMHSSIDPQENSIATVTDAAAGDAFWVTYEDDASTAVTPTEGCTIMVRRLS